MTARKHSVGLSFAVAGAGTLISGWSLGKACYAIQSQDGIYPDGTFRACLPNIGSVSAPQLRYLVISSFNYLVCATLREQPGVWRAALATAARATSLTSSDNRVNQSFFLAEGTAFVCLPACA